MKRIATILIWIILIAFFAGGFLFEYNKQANEDKAMRELRLDIIQTFIHTKYLEEENSLTMMQILLEKKRKKHKITEDEYIDQWAKIEARIEMNKEHNKSF